MIKGEKNDQREVARLEATAGGGGRLPSFCGWKAGSCGYKEVVVAAGQEALENGQGCGCMAGGQQPCGCSSGCSAGGQPSCGWKEEGKREQCCGSPGEEGGWIVRLSRRGRRCGCAAGRREKKVAGGEELRLGAAGQEREGRLEVFLWLLEGWKEARLLKGWKQWPAGGRG